MKDEIMIAPSLLSADFTDLRGELAEVSEADYLHLDIMDGSFVPNMTFGPLVVSALRPVSNLVFDTHLMIVEPARHLEAFVQAGSDIITVHAEACLHLHRVLQQIRTAGVQPGVSLNPATPVTAIQHVLHLVDHILLMTVNPGYGGQAFLPEVLPKIREVAAIRENEGHDYAIAVDGGIDEETVPRVVRAGARVLVAGSAVFGRGDREGSIAALRTAAEKAKPGTNGV